MQVKVSLPIELLGIILMSLVLPVRSQTYLNYDQPYVNPPNIKEPFLTKNDNDNFWKNAKLIREKRDGYKDTEFINKIDWCRYVGESAVLQKKEEYTLNNVIRYTKRCINVQTYMIKKYLSSDILGDKGWDAGRGEFKW